MTELRVGVDGLTVKVALGLTGLVTPFTVTVTLFVPSVALARIVNVAEIDVVLFTTMLLAETPLLPVLIAVSAPAMKLVPVRVTGTLAPWFPRFGTMEVRVGGELIPAWVITWVVDDTGSLATLIVDCLAAPPLAAIGSVQTSGSGLPPLQKFRGLEGNIGLPSSAKSPQQPEGEPVTVTLSVPPVLGKLVALTPVNVYEQLTEFWMTLATPTRTPLLSNCRLPCRGVVLPPYESTLKSTST